MIVVDTSALAAVLFGEQRSDACSAVFESGERLLISAGTVAEALIVAGGRNAQPAMAHLIDKAGLEIVPVTALTARVMGDAYVRWGKGNHGAALNYGDCFAYALAKERDCPLLFIGNDFARTDVRSALAQE